MASTSAEIVIDRPPEAVFDQFLAIDVTQILLGWGPLPAVVGMQDETGVWGAPGAARTLRLGDGSTAREEVVACERPSVLIYKVGGFTNPLIAALSSGAAGEWRFSPEGAGARVVWSYDYAARNALAAAPLALIVALMWRPWMQVGLRAFKRLAEQGGAAATD